MKQVATDIASKDITKFSRVVWSYYERSGRHDLAWRKKTDAYSIVLSEIMLQQTQVARVEEHFKNWKREFPTWKILADSRFSQILTCWQGLGYNRRARYLHEMAKKVMITHGGVFPQEKKQILALPGIGPYTAAAINSFCYNQIDILIETNIRTVIIFHFYKNQEEVSEEQIGFVLKQCLKPGTKAYKNPREWYWALMDYGSHLKSEVGNLNTKSKTYNKQSRFEGSKRQMRSRLLRYILERPASTYRQIQDASNSSDEELIKELLTALTTEKMIVCRNDKYNVTD